MNQKNITISFEICTKKTERAYQAVKLCTLCALLLSKDTDLQQIIPFFEGMVMTWQE